MKAINNFDSVEAVTEKERLCVGGYICKITRVEDDAKREFLKLEYDIADGKFKGYWEANEENFGWRDSFIWSYKEKALGYFKLFVSCVEQSNSGYKWDWNEQSLVGKLVGLVFGEEEYEKRDGSIGTRLKVSKITTVDTIRTQKYTVPPKKTIERTAPAETASISDDDLPFDFD